MKSLLAFVIGLIVIGGVILGLTLHGSAQVIVDLTSCQPITASGSYRLANNVSSASDCFTIRGGYSNITFDGNGKTITTPNKAFDVADLGSGTPSNVTISNFTSTGVVRVFGDATNHVTIRNVNVLGVDVNGSDDVTIDGNTVGTDGIQVNNSDNPWPPLRPIITNNTVTGAVGTQTKIMIEIVGGPSHPCPRIDGLVTENTINNYRNDDPPPEATANMRIRCATHSTVRNNTSRSFGTTLGLYLRDESDDGIYENNVFWTNLYPSLWIASGNPDKTQPSRNTFTSNTFRTDAGYGVYAIGIGTQNIFSYNTFYDIDGARLGYVGGYFGNTYNHNTFYAAGTGAKTFDLMGDNTDGPPADTFTNNIFSYSGTQVFGYDQWKVTRYNGGDYNLFFNRGGALSFGTVSGVSNTTLAQWRTATGDDAHSISVNPQFTNPSTFDFSLQAGSPALNAASDGTNIGAWQSGACVESWSCGAFGTCTNNSQSRTCTDSRSCGTIISRPALTQSCDSTAPTAAITAPTNNASVLGNVSVTASASDNVGVVGVQFKLDGTNLGAEDTTAPYSVSWNTTSTTNATHTLTAVARDAAGLTTMSSVVTVTVANTVGGPCIEDWDTIPCSAWSVCSNGTQTRTCTDFHSCGTTNSRPALTQSCSVDTTAPASVQNLQAS